MRIRLGYILSGILMLLMFGCQYLKPGAVISISPSSVALDSSETTDLSDSALEVEVQNLANIKSTVDKVSLTYEDDDDTFKDHKFDYNYGIDVKSSSTPSNPESAVFTVQVLNTGMKERALIAGTEVLTVNLEFHLLDENGAAYSIAKKAEILFYRAKDATGITIGSIEKFHNDDELDITVVDLGADGKSDLQSVTCELIEISVSGEMADSGMNDVNSKLSDEGGGIFTAVLSESDFPGVQRTSEYVIIARYGTDEYAFKQKR